MTAKRPETSGNRILDGFAARGMHLTELMETVQLELKDVLYEPGEEIAHVYFPLDVVVSIVTRMDDGSTVEIATIGNEGMLGRPVFLGTGSMIGRAIAHIPGSALRMSSRTFAAEIRKNDELREFLQRYVQALFSQVAQQVACNALHTVEERCGRWLLLTHDRVRTDEFPLTQEFLSQMLGVRRSSVTTAAGMLQSAGFISYRRGRVNIVDRLGLEEASCECYSKVKAEYDRVLPTDGRRRRQPRR